jgi:hypothetical protein
MAAWGGGFIIHRWRLQVCQVQLQLQAVAAQALFDHTNWAQNAFLGDQSLLALQFRGPGAAPRAARAWAWLIEVRDWHTCFDLLSQARCEQRRNEDPSPTAHADNISFSIDQPSASISQKYPRPSYGRKTTRFTAPWGCRKAKGSASFFRTITRNKKAFGLYGRVFSKERCWARSLSHVRWLSMAITR